MAIRLYEKAGYVNVGVVRDYYVVDGTLYSAYVFVKYLNGAETKQTSGWGDWWGGIKAAIGW